jgi:outer membrane protein assembly factor BamB
MAASHDYADMVPDAPTSCYGVFTTPAYLEPWPPANSPDGTVALPPKAPCGPQRAGLNAAPAIGPDGTIFVVSHALWNEAYSYVIALRPDFSTKWAASLRDLVHDGCGVKDNQCRAGATPGVDRNTNLPPASAVTDFSTSAPVVLPDGGVLYGSETATYYDGGRGHLLKFDKDGAFRASYDFGYDVTPPVFGDADHYAIYLKDNHYSDLINTPNPWWFFLTKLDASLQPVWKFASTEATSDNPHGYEWCVNAPAVDADGTVYSNSEDGYVHAITSDGNLRDKVRLGDVGGSIYTPLALDKAGHVYALHAGHLLSAGAAP